LLHLIRIISAIITGVFAIYGLAAEGTDVTPYMMFFMGVMVLTIGISEIQKERRRMGFISIIVSIFVFYVSIQGFLLDYTS